MKEFISRKAIELCAIILFTIECCLTTGQKNIYGPYLSPTIYLMAGLGFGLLLMIYSFRAKVNRIVQNGITPYSWNYILYFLWLGGFIYAAKISAKYFNKWNIDIYDASYSDIIPQIGWMVKRQLAGEFPYQLITVWPHDLYPTYQTFQWLPYALAELLEFDYRWLPFVVLTLSLVVFQKINIFSQIGFGYKMIFSILPWCLLLIFVNHDVQQYAHTVESLIVGYYLFFLFTLYSSSTNLKALTSILCLLSRYTFILWLPLLILSLLFHKLCEARNYIILVLGGILLFYVLPFLLIDPHVFTKGFNYHTQAAYHLWSKTGEQFPHLLYEGLGFAGIFYDLVDGDTNQRLDLLRKVHLYFCIGFILIASMIFILKRECIEHQELFLLGSFKFYLALFYSFIQLPFGYLFMLPLFVSCFCLFKLIECGRSRLLPN